MTIEKVLVGKNEVARGMVDYYMIKKLSDSGENFYGIEMVEREDNQITSHIEYFSASATEASEIVNVLYENNVASVHLQEVIDELVD